MQIEHRVRNFKFDDEKGGEENNRQRKTDQNFGSKPTHRRTVIRLNSINHRNQQGCEPQCEGDVAPPVDSCLRSLSVVSQADVTPDRSKYSKWHRNPENQSPVTDG